MTVSHANDTENAEAAQVIETFSSGYQLTEIARTPDGTVRWTRRPGLNRTDRYPPPHPDFRRRAASVSDTDFAFHTPTHSTADHAAWSVPGARTLAAHMLAGTREPQLLHTDLLAAGRGLARLHRLPVEPSLAGVYPEPRWPRRFLDWLRSGQAPRAGAAWHFKLRRHLGPRRWQTLLDMTDRMLHQQRTPVVLHGWPSTGSLVLADDPTAFPRIAVLSGLEVALGAAEVDLACLLGELVEFRYYAQNAGNAVHVAGVDAAVTALLDGYGPAVDRSAVATGAVVRVATHAHDFAAYVGWHTALDTYAAIITELLDDPDRTVPTDPTRP
ncbi:hypothetical protein [Nocardia sp. NPDC051570]|uniref:hypothetical protein n=1 Tax=Nocardia sp. NPDC051570 TaxID=3364324 RepID=UPI0037983DA1